MTHSATARILKAVNALIVILLTAGLGATYWYVWRPLPQRSGSVAAPVAAPVAVSFDSLGEPHIRASSQQDAWIVQGYVTAQDRLWQMDSLRRYASGTLAEVLGPAALDTDRDMRRLRLRRLAEAAYVRLPATDRAGLADYTLGVNEFIATHLDNLPIEFTLLGYQPRPWSAIDSLLVGLYMFRDLTTTWRDEIAKRAMLADGDAGKVNFLFADRAGNEPAPGSNGWAIAGSHTASGKPLLSSDMHLAYSLPGIWYMAHLQAPGLDVAGVTLPGVPGVVVGHNQHIAWGITNLQFDVQDLYSEKLDDRTGRYLYQGNIEQARGEREIIQVKGARAVEMATWVTRHGPLFIVDGHEHLALRWTAAEPGLFQFPILDIDRAENWQQFTTALSRWVGPGSNFVYADTAGNIGYHAAAMLPKRRGYSGDVPVDGSSGNFDWDGFIPFEQLPSVYNPASGIIASANQNPFPRDYPYPVNGNFAPPYRVLRIRELLSAHNGWRAADMLGVQGDIYSAFSKFLSVQVVAAVDKRGAHNVALDPAVALLRAWNGSMDKDLGAPFLISLVYQHVRSSVAGVAAPGNGQVYEFNMGPSVIETLLRERPDGWFQDYDAMLLRALMDAVDEGKRIQGRDVQRWRYGNYLRIEIDQPVIHAALRKLPGIGKALDFFEIGPVAMSGSATTVRQTTRALAPSMRMTADLGDWDRSLLNIQIGQSGQPLSSHYKDQWNDYYNVKSYPMQYGKVVAKQTLEFRPGAK
jgi:penicillin amidase